MAKVKTDKLQATEWLLSDPPEEEMCNERGCNHRAGDGDEATKGASGLCLCHYEGGYRQGMHFPKSKGHKYNCDGSLNAR